MTGQQSSTEILTAIPAAPSVAKGRARPRFLASLGTVLGGQLACAAIALATEICYARLLGPSGRGLVSLCMMAMGVGALAGGLGGEIPIVIWTADSTRKPSDWLPSVIFWGAIGSALASFLWAATYWLWHPPFLHGITSPLAALVLATIPVSVFSAYFTAMLTGHERFRLRAGLSAGTQLAELIAVVALVLILGRTAEIAIGAILFGLSIGAIATALVQWDTLRDIWKAVPAKTYLSKALSLGLRGQLGNVATFFNYRLDVFIVNYYLDPAQVGLYAVGVVVSESLWQIPHAAATALFPRTARTLDQGASEFTCRVLRLILALAIVSGIAMALLSPLVIPLVFGAKFRPSVPVIWWILPGTIALSLAKVLSADLAARGRPEFSSVFAFASLIVTVVLDLTLIPRMGIQGAALASSAAYLLDTILLAIALKSLLKITWKSFLVPTQEEVAAYKQVWPRFKSMLRPAAAAASPGRIN
ncbi:MAG: oligosaccharide flippase family protein [Candidatus Acidiferrales bacterium]